MRASVRSGSITRPSSVAVSAPEHDSLTSMARFPVASGGSDAKFIFTQGSPAATWNITHGLGKFPSVTVVDSTKDEVEGDIVYLNNNQLEVKFSGAFAGAAYLN